MNEEEWRGRRAERSEEEGGGGGGKDEGMERREGGVEE